VNQQQTNQAAARLSPALEQVLQQNLLRHRRWLLRQQIRQAMEPVRRALSLLQANKPRSTATFKSLCANLVQSLRNFVRNWLN